MNNVEKDIRINDEIIQYVENGVIPRYKEFDKGHNIDHVKMVISNSLEIAEEHGVNFELVYVIAAFHDLGLKIVGKITISIPERYFWMMNI